MKLQEHMSCMDCIPKGSCAFSVWKSQVENPHFILKSEVVLNAEALFSLFLRFYSMCSHDTKSPRQLWGVQPLSFQSYASV